MDVVRLKTFPCWSPLYATFDIIQQVSIGYIDILSMVIILILSVSPSLSPFP